MDRKNQDANNILAYPSTWGEVPVCPIPDAPPHHLWHRPCIDMGMATFPKAHPQPSAATTIPKNNQRLALMVLGVLLALGAAVMIAIGFVDASIVAPEETEGPAPEIVKPGTLPD